MKFILYNYNLKRLVHKIWQSKWLNDSFGYRFLLNRQIKRKMEEYKNRPFCVRVENTNLCNAHCVICPRDQMTRPQGVMNRETYEKIINQCAALGVDYVNLHNYGEPLIDKEFVEKVIYAKKKGIKKITTNTNASLLDEETSCRILASGLDELFVSIDAAHKNTYEKVRAGLDYQKLVDNLLAFVKMKKQSNARTELVVNFVKSKDNAEEVQEFIDFWKNKADHVSVSYAHDWVGSKKDLTEKKAPKTPCRLLFSDLTVAWNGDYILCCVDFNSEVVLGNMKSETIAEIWKNNPRLNHYRELHSENRAEELKICDKCTMNTVWWF